MANKNPIIITTDAEKAFDKSKHPFMIKLSTKCAVLCSVVFSSSGPHGLQPARLLYPWESSGKSTGMGCHFLLQGTFLTQGSNLGLLHCRQILYCCAKMGTCLQIAPCEALALNFVKERRGVGRGGRGGARPSLRSTYLARRASCRSLGQTH